MALCSDCDSAPCWLPGSALMGDTSYHSLRCLPHRCAYGSLSSQSFAYDGAIPFAIHRGALLFPTLPRPPPLFRICLITLDKFSLLGYIYLVMVKTLLQIVPNILDALYGEGLTHAYHDGFTYFLYEYYTLPAKVVRTK